MHPAQTAILLFAIGFVMAIVAVMFSFNLPQSRTWAAAAFVSLASFMGSFGSLALALWRAFT